MNYPNSKLIQEYLRDKGFYHGDIDGILGRLSRKAMSTALDVRGWTGKHLKIGVAQLMCRDAGIDPGQIDGIMGPKTRGAISALYAQNEGVSDEPETDDPLANARNDMPWFEYAQTLLGTREIKGKRHNPLIMGWAKEQNIWYPTDEVPWCGLFVSHCLHAKFAVEPQPENPLGARNWLKFGNPVPAQLGAVLVFYRGKRSGWQGHVGFYAGEDDKAYHVLGGNQSNAVNVKRIAKNRLLGARWPSKAGSPPGIIRTLDSRGRLSRNEA